MRANGPETWERYRETELRRAEPLLRQAGFILDETQVHIKGERYLTKERDVGGGGLKLVLTGRRTSDSVRVIIKVSSDPQGIKEIERERACRTKVHTINFALRTFKTPEELYYGRHGDLVISITAYVEQERSFFEHALDEQFFLALRALETQEGVHATTHSHAAIIEDTFGSIGAAYYLSQFGSFVNDISRALPDRTELIGLLEDAQSMLDENRTIIERYSGFLTHADFVPNNLRVANNDIFLLDFSSVHFGNKYESWARFVNFMVHHNPKLEHALSEYVRANRGAEEHFVLRLMRIYKIGFLLAYYAKALEKTSGNLRILTEHRLRLWSEAMQAILHDRPISHEIVASYVEELHKLRSEDERARQKELLGPQEIGV
jgi:hypothetical protein